MKKTSARISTLVAVSGGLAALPAAALELGEAQVNSSLGQPLRASIAFALAPHESLVSSCVSLQGGQPLSDLPTVGSATISVANGVISILGSNVIRDPLVSMRVNIRCPYTANLSREYMLFVDPATASNQISQTAAAIVQPASAAVPPATARTTTTRAATTSRPRTASIAAIDSGTRHRVQPGESLSEIAQAIKDRPIGLWAAVGAIFDANPDAFIDDDPNKLKAGSWLFIPDFGSAASTTVADNAVFSSTSEAGDASDASNAVAGPGVTDSVAAADEPVASLPASNPGNPYIVGNGVDSATVVDIPDTALDSPLQTSTSPNVAAASVRPASTDSGATNWLFWLVGAGIAVISGLLFFGRRLRERFASAPIGAVAVPERRRPGNDTQRLEAISSIEVELQELSATQENAILDADLIIGTGLQHGGDVDLAQDFGFAATTELDLELPEEMSSGGAHTASTDIIPPMKFDVDSILESEVLPEFSDDQDEYDMSVIVDATKMPFPDDVTQKDLAAVPLETSDETLITGDYTVSHEIDYKVLEQDYEDEFTATQALNSEITRAAAELAARMDEEYGDSENTAEMSMASVAALDITAQLPANNDDDISDLDDTGINEAVTVDMRQDESTVEMPARKNKSG